MIIATKSRIQWSGLRRRGYSPQAICDFIHGIGVTKSDGFVDVAFLDCLRQDLNKHAERRMGVLDPLKVVITNYPEEQVEELTTVNNPEDESGGARQVPFSRELYVEREVFMEDSPKNFYCLAPSARCGCATPTSSLVST